MICFDLFSADHDHHHGSEHGQVNDFEHNHEHFPYHDHHSVHEHDHSH